MPFYYQKFAQNTHFFLQKKSFLLFWGLFDNTIRLKINSTLKIDPKCYMLLNYDKSRINKYIYRIKV